MSEPAHDLAFERAPVGYVLTDSDGRVSRVNPRFEELVGRGRAELEGGRFEDLLAAGGRIWYQTHFAPLLLQTGEVREVALDFRTADGGFVPTLVSARMDRDASGRPGLVYCAVLDARARRSYEKELLRVRRELEVALAERDQSFWHLRKIQEVLPICMDCETVRPEREWVSIVDYLRQNELVLSHGLCPGCYERRVGALAAVESGEAAPPRRA